MKKLLLTALLLTSCSSSPTPTPSNIKQKNQKGEFLYRTHNENLFVADPQHKNRPPTYPWEHSLPSTLPTITKDFFRCKGSALNPERLVQEDHTLKRYYDCSGPEKHSLPTRDGKEFIYPILIDLMNYIQSQTQKRVVITCGHRCPEHNAYADSSKQNQSSKHMIGAEVSFYVQGLESQPHLIANLIQQFYKSSPDLANFHYPDPHNKNILQNKEIILKIVPKDEGRNFDNRHPYPYLSIQVRYDRSTKQNVPFSWDKAHRSIIRF